MPGAEGTLWAADPEIYPGSLRKVFEKDFKIYHVVERFAKHTTDLFCLSWLPWKLKDEVSMYTNHTGLGLFNPLNVVPLYSLFKVAGGSDVSVCFFYIIFYIYLSIIAILYLCFVSKIKLLTFFFPFFI